MFLLYKCNNRLVLLPNFKAVGQTQAELYNLKIGCMYKTPFHKFGHNYGLLFMVVYSPLLY